MFDDIKLPPSSYETERTVLGTMIQERKAISLISDYLNVDDFYFETHKTVYSCIMNMFNANIPIYPELLFTEIKKSISNIDENDIAPLIIALVSRGEIASVIIHHAKIIRECSMLRKLIHTAQEITSMAYNPKGDVMEIVNMAEHKIMSIQERSIESGFTSIYDLMKKCCNKLDDRITNGTTSMGLTTGYYHLDSLTNGLRPGEITVIAARASMGKTFLALNIARNIYKRGKSVAIFSIEMNENLIAERIICSEAGLDQNILRNDKAGNEELIILSEVADKNADKKLFINDSESITVSEMKAQCRRLKASKGLDLVIVDYLQLMGGETDDDDEDYKKITKISRGLKRLSRELKIPIIALAQLNRDPDKRPVKRPFLSDLKGSGQIEQDSDVVMMIYRPGYYGETEISKAGYTPGIDDNVAEIIVNKNRSGATGDIKLHFDGETGNFSNIYNR